MLIKGYVVPLCCMIQFVINRCTIPAGGGFLPLKDTKLSGPENPCLQSTPGTLKKANLSKIKYHTQNQKQIEGSRKYFENLES